MLTRILAAADPGGSAPPWLNTAAIFGLITLAVAIVGGFIGVQMLARSGKVNPAKQGKTALNVVMAVVVIVGAVGGAIVAVATGSLDFLVKQ